MRVLYAVQRYGTSIVGGAEAAARSFAEHLVARGHDVEVITSCAHSYVDWANVHPSGTTTLNGVTVHRLPVDDVRTPERFGPIHGWMIGGPRPAPLFAQWEWMKRMGPDLVGLSAWVSEHAPRFDAAVFMTYLYSTTAYGLPAAANRVPTVLQPTAHDEPPIWLRLFDGIFRQPDAFLFFTPEEREFVRQRFGIEAIGDTPGIGIDVEPSGDVAAFRARFCLADRPYLVYVGRIDAIKGSRELFHFFESYQARNHSEARLVFVGERFGELPDHDDIVFTGFLGEEEKRTALAGSLALIQPSRFESFSIVLCEAWAQGRPALVHRDSHVLVGQARRSGGAIPYRGYAEFEAALDLLLAEPALGDRMGAAGAAYVAREYSWDHVMARMEDVLHLAVSRFRDRPLRRHPATSDGAATPLPSRP